MACFTVRVPADFCKTERLDSYIASLPLQMNRSKLKAGLAQITVNGKPQKVSYKVKPLDDIFIEWHDTVPNDIEPEDIPLDILYEDENVCVVNKAQGMVTHPALSHWSGTLVNALLFHWQKEKIVGIHHIAAQAEKEATMRPGIVHRLDKDTSGVIITAKNRAAEEWLQQQFVTRNSLVKEYIAICQGRPPAKCGRIKTRIIRDPQNRQRFKAVENTTAGKYAESAYSCIACYGGYSLMRVRIKTGRTHQIRVHLKFIQCPILGDALYGKKDTLFKDVTLMLHARLLAIRLPQSETTSTFYAPTPERFLKVLAALHKAYPKTLLSTTQ